MSHGGFILAAYGLTALVLLGVVGAILADYAALRRDLARFPARDDSRGDAP